MYLQQITYATKISLFLYIPVLKSCYTPVSYFRENGILSIIISFSMEGFYVPVKGISGFTVNIAVLVSITPGFVGKIFYLRMIYIIYHVRPPKAWFILYESPYPQQELCGCYIFTHACLIVVTAFTTQGTSRNRRIYKKHFCTKHLCDVCVLPKWLKPQKKNSCAHHKSTVHTPGTVVHA